jgi:hypothetical protein
MLEKADLSPASGTRADRCPRKGPSHFNGLDLMWGRVFYLAIVRSVFHSLQSRAFIEATTTFRHFDFGADARHGTRHKHAVDMRLCGCQRDRLSVVLLFAGGRRGACGMLA